MNIGHIALAAIAAVFVVGEAQAGPLPIAKHTLTQKTADYEISIEYPLTGMKAIDDDLVRSVKEYAAQYRNLSKGAHADIQRAYTLDTTYNIVRNDDAGFAVEFESETDMGGAHPNQDMWTANYLRADGWRVYLPELFDSSRALPKMSAMVIADLDRRLTTGAEPATDKDWVARGAAPVGTNFAVFALLPNKIHIWFLPYQVASYAAGPQESEIPLAPLKPFLRADPHAPAASFDCAKAALPMEKTICSDVELARLDRKVSEAYANALIEAANDAAKTGKRNEQRAWLARRNDACKGQAAAVACLTGVYKERLAVLAPGG